MRVSLIWKKNVLNIIIENNILLKYYNLSIHPKMTNHWRAFDFGANNLEAMFQNITFDQEDTFIMYALNGYPDSKIRKSQKDVLFYITFVCVFFN